MVAKRGKFGEFLACSGYPDCKNTRSLNANGPGKSTGVSCHANGCDGEIVEKKSKRGKIFYGCNRFPDWKNAMWDKPVNRQCPVCDAKFLVKKTSKKEGTYLACLTEGCGFKSSDHKKA